MTEKEFWKFLENSWMRGRANVVTGGVIDDSDPRIVKTGEYFGGHSLLPADYDKIPLKTIQGMAGLLLRKEGNARTQEAILIILAHHPSRLALEALREYVKSPDKGLEFFSRLALDECEIWNED